MMGYAVVAEAEPVFRKSKGEHHVPRVTPYFRGGPTGKIHQSKTRGPGARVARYRKQLQRDKVRFTEEPHPPGFLECYPDTTVTVFTWAD